MPRAEPIKFVWGRRLRHVREKEGISQQRMADDLGWSQTTISRYESGKRMASESHRRQMAGYLGVEMEKLFGW